MRYRTYDAGWNRAGYSDTQQYPGQANLTADFPPTCPECGQGMHGCGDPEWLEIRGIGPIQAWQADQYAAWCKGNHVYHAVELENT